MPNRRGREIPIRDFDPHGRIIEGLTPVPRPSGEEDAAIATATSRVSDVLNRIADEAAEVEGKRAGAIAGNEPDFRPTGTSTIRGRAFNEAATKQYLDNLDGRTRTDMQAVYEKHRNNPAALTAALQALHKEMTDRDVFPEVQGHFNKQFATWAATYRAQATHDAERRAHDGIRAGLFQSVAEIDTATRRMIETLDPDSPGVEDMVASAVQRKTDMWQRAADNGAITQAQAELKKQETRNVDFGKLVIARAAKLTTPEQMIAFRDKFQKDFAADKYSGKLDAAGYDGVLAELSKVTKVVDRAVREQTEKLKKDVNAFVQREADGLAPPSAEWDDIAAAAKRLPGGDQLMATADAKRKLARQLLAGSIDQAQDIMAVLRDQVRKTGGGDPIRAELLQFGDALVTKALSEVNVDQLGYAQKRGLIPIVTPLDFESLRNAEGVKAFADQLRARTAQARAVAQSLERAPVFLRPEEIARIREIVNSGDARALALTHAIIDGAGVDATRVLNQLGTDAPVIAQVGVILANGGSQQAAYDAFLAHRMKAEKLKVGAPKAAEFEKLVNAQYDTAFMLQPEDGSRAKAAARAISETRLTISGLNPDSNTAWRVYEEAAQLAVGAVFVNGVRYGGVSVFSPPWFAAARGYHPQQYKVLVPPGVRGDSFREVLLQIRDGDLALLPVPPEAVGERPYLARDLHAAMPVATRAHDGTLGYRFALGDPLSSDPKWIRGVDGKPFVLPINLLLPELRKRIPGAFLGNQP